MSMSVGEKDDGDGAMSEINTTPLVDVMLVLLIIFLITLPVAIQTAPVKLPTLNNIPTTTKPENVVVSVDSDGGVYWNATKMSNGQSELRSRLRTRMEAAYRNAGSDYTKIPEVHLRADKDAAWKYIGGVVFTAQQSAVPKFGFISEQDLSQRQAR
jgi:biopolymer transport protein ExbD